MANSGKKVDVEGSLLARESGGRERVKKLTGLNRSDRDRVAYTGGD
jgi:hypothetical protein